MELYVRFKWRLEHKSRFSLNRVFKKANRDQKATTDSGIATDTGKVLRHRKSKRIQTDLSTVQTSSPEAGRGQREGQSSKYRQADNPESKMVTDRNQNRQGR